jgi:DNA-binding MarR family transcriptional regulator
MPAPPPDPRLANLLGEVALDVMTRMSAAIEDSTGHSMSQATALSALANYANGSSIDGLRRCVGLTHSATVRLVDRLAELGLVERRAGTVDRRVAAIHLTPAGRRTVRKIRSARNAVLSEWLGRLSPSEQAAMTRILDSAAGAAVDPDDIGMGGANYVCRLCDAAACGYPGACPVTQAAIAADR